MRQSLATCRYREQSSSVTRDVVQRILLSELNLNWLTPNLYNYGLIDRDNGSSTFLSSDPHLQSVSEQSSPMTDQPPKTAGRGHHY
jgi:hypothetical protein